LKYRDAKRRLILILPLEDTFASKESSKKSKKNNHVNSEEK